MDTKQFFMGRAKVFLLVLFLAVVFYLLINYAPSERKNNEEAKESYKNISYIIDGQPVTLVGGTSKGALVFGLTQGVVTNFFGNEVEGDLNGDSIPDVALLLVQNTKGDGEPYYVVAALQVAGEYKGTNAILLGDGITPQITGVKDNIITVTYITQKEDELTTRESPVSVSKYFRVFGERLVEL